MAGKREDYISWDEYFMGIAFISSLRSKDPRTQVGACIVSEDNKILSMGYNGFPKGCSDDEFPWAREGDELDTKYPTVARIAETRNDIAVVIQLLIQRSDIHIHIGMCLLHRLNSFRCGNDAHKMNLLTSLVL